jgi:hypothetical protein
LGNVYTMCFLGTSTLVKDTTKSADLISWIGAIQATGRGKLWDKEKVAL